MRLYLTPGNRHGASCPTIPDGNNSQSREENPGPSLWVLSLVALLVSSSLVAVGDVAEPPSDGAKVGGEGKFRNLLGCTSAHR